MTDPSQSAGAADKGGDTERVRQSDRGGGAAALLNSSPPTTPHPRHRRALMVSHSRSSASSFEGVGFFKVDHFFFFFLTVEAFAVNSRNLFSFLGIRFVCVCVAGRGG